ncbi:MAG TPA: hypothetical protein VLX64_05915, partial [Thermoplasmata archaeon]|nr:hypothetical protein [Thermoplasmata archaeon]
MHPVLRLIRAGNAAVSFVGTAVAALAAEGTGFATSLDFVATVLLASGSTFCVTAAGNVLNDV